MLEYIYIYRNNIYHVFVLNMFLTPSHGPTSRMAACNKCNEPLCCLWKGVRIGVNDAKRLSVCLLDLGAFLTNGSFWVESTALMEVSGEADKKG